MKGCHLCTKPVQGCGKDEKEPRTQDAAVGKYVLQTLGQPANLHRVQVRWLWEGHYRVNVFVGVDATTATVAHSYFLVADGAGTIVKSTPKIVRHYGKEGDCLPVPVHPFSS